MKSHSPDPFDKKAVRNRKKAPESNFLTTGEGHSDLPFFSQNPCSNKIQDVEISCVFDNGLPRVCFTFHFAQIDLPTWRQHFASGKFHVKEPFNLPAFVLRSIGLKNYLIRPGIYEIFAKEGHLNILF